jgi:hypothetical protein
MPFIASYNGAMKLLAEMGTGKCKTKCKSSWIRNFKYALKTKTNPLKLTAQQRKIMTKKIASVSGRNGKNKHKQTLKKYKERKSPPYSANENCGKKMKGNDGLMYEAIKNKNNICVWKKI